MVMMGTHIRTTCPHCGSTLSMVNSIDPKTLRRVVTVECPQPGCYREAFDAARTLSSGM